MDLSSSRKAAGLRGRGCNLIKGLFNKVRAGEEKLGSNIQSPFKGQEAVARIQSSTVAGPDCLWGQPTVLV